MATNMTGKIILKRGKEKPLLNQHPWIFSGAIARIENASDGDTVEVYDAGGDASSRNPRHPNVVRDDMSGRWLARAAYNSRSQIAARVWTFERDEEIDREFFKRRIIRAVEFRESVRAKSLDGTSRMAVPHSQAPASPSASVPANASPLQVSNDAYRLVNAESDGLPGVIVDRYDDFLVAQFLTLGAELHKREIVECLVKMFEPRGVYERSDVDARKKEGLPLVMGVLGGDEPPDKIEIVENGLRFFVDVKRGHKTGFYLDQRENRQQAINHARHSGQ